MQCNFNQRHCNANTMQFTTIQSNYIEFTANIVYFDALQRNLHYKCDANVALSLGVYYKAKSHTLPLLQNGNKKVTKSILHKLPKWGKTI